MTCSLSSQVGNVDALSCYYAHGEQNPCFQRRCFWMLEPAYEHIVLVQYREVGAAEVCDKSLYASIHCILSFL
jgi:hypothetical protein